MENKMKKLILILPYFGNFPNYFALWLKSASYNKNIDYLLVTDNDKLDSYENIMWEKMSFSEMKDLVRSKFDFNIKLNRPYKLCDFKPAYGYIFSEYIKEYKYWGHCDPDIIWGNLDYFINDPINKNKDRIYQHGHLCIYKNNKENNMLFIKKSSKHGITYKDVFNMNYSAHFDEGPIINELFKDKNNYNKVDFADIVYQQFHFKLAQDTENNDCKQVYQWNNGRLFGYFFKDGEIMQKEFAYIHLQKRKMEIDVENVNRTNCFNIIPNRFIWNKEIDIDFIINNSKDSKKYSYMQKNYELVK